MSPHLSALVYALVGCVLCATACSGPDDTKRDLSADASDVLNIHGAASDEICRDEPDHDTCVGTVHQYCTTRGQLIREDCADAGADGVCKRNQQTGSSFCGNFLVPCEGTGGDCDYIGYASCDGDTLTECVDVGLGYCGRTVHTPCADAGVCHGGECLPAICRERELCSSGRGCTADLTYQRCEIDTDGCPVVVEEVCDTCLVFTGCTPGTGVDCTSAIVLPGEGRHLLVHRPVLQSAHEVCGDAPGLDLVFSVEAPPRHLVRVRIDSLDHELHGTDCSGACLGQTDDDNATLVLTNDAFEPRRLYFVSEETRPSGERLDLFVEFEPLM